MSIFDRASTMDVEVAFNSTAISSATTTAGVLIDTADCGAVTFLMQLGATVAGTFTPKLQDGALADGSDLADVADQWLIGTEAGSALTVTNTVKKLGYVGKKRYVKLSFVTTGGSVSGTVSAMAVKTDVLKEPAA